jgi:hypothetical protein
MPRIIASNSDSIDFCKQHFPDEDVAEDIYGDLGNGPDRRGNCFSYDAEHPPYEYEEYLCDTCEIRLEREDN